MRQLLCAALVAAAAGTEQKEPSGTLHEGRNCYQGNGGGGDIDGKSPFEEENTLPECVAACADEPLCQGLVRLHGSERGPCWLRKDIRMENCDYSRNYDTWIMKRGAGEFPPSFVKRADENCWLGHGCKGMIGYDPVPGLERNREACEALCAVMEQCQAYVTHEDERGCWLKTDVDPDSLVPGRGHFHMWVKSDIDNMGKRDVTLKIGDIISIRAVEGHEPQGVVVSKLILGYCSWEAGASGRAESRDGKTVDVDMFLGQGCKSVGNTLTWSFSIPAVDGETQFDCPIAEGGKSGRCVAELQQANVQISICPAFPVNSERPIWRELQVGSCVDYSGFSAKVTQQEHGKLSVATSWGSGCNSDALLNNWDIHSVDGETKFPCQTVDGTQLDVECTAVLGNCREEQSSTLVPGAARTINICPVARDSTHAIFPKITERGCERFAGGAIMATPVPEGLDVTTYWGDCSSGYTTGGLFINAVDGKFVFGCPTVTGSYDGVCVASTEPCPEPTTTPELEKPNRIIIRPTKESELKDHEVIFREAHVDGCVDFAFSSARATRVGDSVEVQTAWGPCADEDAPKLGSFSIPAVDGKSTFKCAMVVGGQTEADCVARYFSPSFLIEIKPVGDPPDGVLVLRAVAGDCINFAGGSTTAEFTDDQQSVVAVQFWGEGCSPGSAVGTTTFKLDGETQFDCWTVEGNRKGKCVASPAAPPMLDNMNSTTSIAPESGEEDVDAMGWKTMDGYNCWGGVGAEVIKGKEESGETSFSACAKLCRDEPICEGFVMPKDQDNGHCFLRTKISIPDCRQDDGYSVHLKPGMGEQEIIAKYRQASEHRAFAVYGDPTLGFAGGLFAVCALGAVAGQLCFRRGAGRRARDATSLRWRVEEAPRNERVPIMRSLEGEEESDF